MSKKLLKKIAILLPMNDKSTLFLEAKEIAKILFLGSRACNEPVDIVFSVIKNEYDLNMDFSELIEIGIQIRETSWNVLSKEDLRVMLDYVGAGHNELDSSFYIYPSDGVSNFHDCDYWFLISDFISAPLAPFKPYFVWIHNYLERYNSDFFKTKNLEPSFETTKCALSVLTKFPSTKEDGIQYAGVVPERIHVLPFSVQVFNSVSDKKVETKVNYFFCYNNFFSNEKLEKILESLLIYYNELNGNLKCYLIQNMQQPDSNKIFERYSSKYPAIRENFILLNDISLVMYKKILTDASFYWRPTRKDAHIDILIQAAYHGIPSVTDDDIEVQFIKEKFKLNLLFCDSDNPIDMAKKLYIMQENRQKYLNELSTQKIIQESNFEKIAPCFWEKFLILLSKLNG